MLSSDSSGYQEKSRVWSAITNANIGVITYDEFKMQLAVAVKPINVRSLAANQELSHNGLCIRGGVAEKFLTRLKIID
jgi:hypothetical protein